MPAVCLLVEGTLGQAVGRRILAETGVQVAAVYGKKGYGYIKKRIAAFNQWAAGMRYLALADLMDSGYSCAPDRLSAIVPRRHRNMYFRVVVREVESWLLADHVGVSQFLSVPLSKISERPEELPNPKAKLIAVAA